MASRPAPPAERLVFTAAAAAGAQGGGFGGSGARAAWRLGWPWRRRLCSASPVLAEASSELLEPWRSGEGDEAASTADAVGWQEETEKAQASGMDARAHRRRIVGCGTFACLLGAMALLVYLLQGGGEALNMTPWHAWPVLEGEVLREPYFVQHLGGFCFGHRRVERNEVVGVINFALDKEGTGAWQGKGGLYFLAFDDESARWPAAQRARNWQELVAHANTCTEILFKAPLHNTSMQSVSSYLRASANFQLGIKEKFRRKWHVVLLGLGFTPALPAAEVARYRVEGEEALAAWGRGEKGPPNGRCPGEPIEAMKEYLWDYMVSPPAPPPPPPGEPSRPPLASQKITNILELCSRAHLQ